MNMGKWPAGLAGAACALFAFAPHQTAAQISPEVSIDPAAEAIMREWIANPPQDQNLHFVVSDTLEREEEGVRVTHTHQRTATLSRPNRLRVESRGDAVNRDVIYDGETITIHDLDHGVYGQLEFAGTIDEMIDALQEWYDVSMPLADLLGDERAHMLDGVQSGRSLGTEEINGHPCNHVAFTQEGMGWEAWIDAGERAIMRKLVISHSDEAGAPVYTLTLESAETPAEVSAELFAFTPPEGAIPIRFLETIEPSGSEAGDEATSEEAVQ